MRPAPDRRAVAWGIALALMLTMIEVGLFDVAMRREIARVGHAPPDRVLHVELIEEERPLAPPVVTEPAPPLRFPAPAQHRARVARRQGPREPAPETLPRKETPRLFGLDGRVLLPEAGDGTHSGSGMQEGSAHGDAFARTNPVPYTPTRFNSYWPDVRETLGEEIMRKTTIVYGWRTPWGTVVECKASLILLGIGGCGWGPAPRLTIEQLRAIRADPPPSPLQPAPADTDPQSPAQP